MYVVMNGTHKTQYRDQRRSKMEPSADSRVFHSKSSFLADENNARGARGGGHCSSGDGADDEAAEMATHSQLLWHILPTLLAVLAPANICHVLLFLIWFSSGVLHLRVSPGSYCVQVLFVRLLPCCLQAFLGSFLFHSSSASLDLFAQPN